MSKEARQRSIRELGGEIWAELRDLEERQELHWETRSRVVDVVMGVLARYSGHEIINDPDLEVLPLPKKFPG